MELDPEHGIAILEKRKQQRGQVVGPKGEAHETLESVLKMRLMVERCDSGSGSTGLESGFYTPVEYDTMSSLEHHSPCARDIQDRMLKQWGSKEATKLISVSDERRRMEEYESTVERLKDGQGHIRLSAAMSVRAATRFSIEARKILCNAGAIPPLLSLLQEPNLGVCYMAAMALLNLAIGSTRNKQAIYECGAIPILVRLLRPGSAPSLRESAAAVIMSLAASDQLKPCIGKSGVIPFLVDVLDSGTAQGRSDALRALLNLSLYKGNRASIVQAGTVGPLFKIIMRDGKETAEKAVVLLTQLYMSREGREAIASTQQTCSALLQILRGGSFSQSSKEQTVRILVSLSADMNVRRKAVSALGILPSIMEIALLGSNPRAQEKATKLLRIIKEHRADEGILFDEAQLESFRTLRKNGSASIAGSSSSHTSKDFGLRASESTRMSCSSVLGSTKKFSSLRSLLMRGLANCRSDPISDTKRVLPSKLLKSLCS